MRLIKSFRQPQCWLRLAPRFSTMQTSNFAKSAQLKTEEMHFHNLDESLMKKYTEIGRDEALSMLRRMITIRKMEDKANGMYKARNIRGFCHLSNGQEAANVGLIDSISSRDVICDSYRMHGIAFLRGKSVRSILGELCGRSSGSSRGKGGSMHFYSKDNLYGGYGIVGSQVPIANGVAFAMKYREDNHISYADANDERRIAIGMYGDGAANQGQIHESFNMAKLWNLPMLFLCENNLYGMGTSVERASADARFYMRCHYIPGLRVNGQDLVSVLCGTRFAADYVRSGQGPFLLEYYTYRFLGHSMSDPGLSYRTRDEIKEMRKTNDPIELFAEKVLGANLCSDKEIDGIKREVEEEIDLAAEQALGDPFPEQKELYEHIYVKYLGDSKIIRGRDCNETYNIEK